MKHLPGGFPVVRTPPQLLEKKKKIVEHQNFSTQRGPSEKSFNIYHTKKRSKKSRGKRVFEVVAFKCDLLAKYERKHNNSLLRRHSMEGSMAEVRRHYPC